MHPAYKSTTLRKAKQHLQKGGVIAYPTEFCYGLGCDPHNRVAINKIFKLKKRKANKSLIVIASKQAQLNSLTTRLSDTTKEQLKQYWPGFYSILLPAKPSINTALQKNSKIACRVTKHHATTQLCNYLNMAIVSTSCNHSGKKPIRRYKDCIRLFGKKILVLKGITDFKKSPSRIIDLENQQILR